PAVRNRKEAPVAIARGRPTAPDAHAPRAHAGWEDTRIAPGYPPGSDSPGPRLVFEIPNNRPKAPWQTPPHIPHRGSLRAGARRERAPSLRPNFQNALRIRPPRSRKSQLFRADRPAAPTRSRVPTSFAPAAFCRNGPEPAPDCATSRLRYALRRRERF